MTRVLGTLRRVVVVWLCVCVWWRRRRFGVGSQVLFSFLGDLTFPVSYVRTPVRWRAPDRQRPVSELYKCVCVCMVTVGVTIGH